MALEEIEVLVRRYLAIRHAIEGSYDDGEGYIYYLSDVTGEQILWRAFKTPSGYRHDIPIPWDRRVGGYRVSPAGHIAFTTDVDGDEKWSIYIARGNMLRLVSGEDGSINNIGEWSPSGRFLSYASNARNGVDFDVYVYDILTGSKVRIMEGEGILAPSRWISDDALLIVRMNTYRDTDILLASRSGGSSINLTKHSGEAQNRSPVPIDDRLFAFITNDGEEFAGIALYDLEKRGWKYVVRERWDIELIDFMGGAIAYTVNEDGASVLKVYRLGEGSPYEILRIWGTVDGLDMFREGILLSINSPKHGQEIFALDASGVLERVTYSPKIGVAEESFVEPRVFKYRSFDGLEIHGLIYRPHRSLGNPPPAVVYLHGGPESQERVAFNRVQQALLSLGIAVVAPNYRGSSGYGKSFIHLDDVDRRMGAVHDVYYAIEHLSREGEVGADRLCVMGGSYGGYLALMMLSIYPDMWRCGVEIVGIVNLVTFIRNTGAWRRRYRVVEYGDPEVHGEVMLKLSPISYVDRIKAPLMVIHGAKDPRVPVTEAEQIVEALRSRGVEVRYIRLEDEGHGVSKVRNRVRVYSEALRFIYKNLGG